MVSCGVGADVTRSLLCFVLSMGFLVVCGGACRQGIRGMSRNGLNSGLDRREVVNGVRVIDLPSHLLHSSEVLLSSGV